MRTISLSTKDTSEISSLIETQIQANFRPTLGIVFCSPNQNIERIVATFNHYHIDLLGCSSAGEIHDAELSEGGVTMLLMDLNRDYFKIVCESYDKRVFGAAQQIRNFADQSFPQAAIFVLSGGLTVDGEEVVDGLKSTNNTREIPIFGGLAGDDLLLEKTTVFTHQYISNKAIGAIIFDESKVEIKGLATSGWQALGTEHVITKAIGNTIYSINNEPALDYFIRFFGYYDDAHVNQKTISTMSAQYPFQVKREGGFVLRSPIMSNERDRSIMLGGRLAEGDAFQFSISPGIEVVDKTVADFEHFHTTAANEADALILVSCKGRHAALGPFLEDEIGQIHDFWRRPMIGFLSYGEIGNLKNGICEFHNETCSLITLREK